MACHPGPTVVVTALSALLALAVGVPAPALLVLAGCVLAGQLSIGWSNDWLDAARDAQSDRTDKPTVTGAIDATTLRACAIVAAVVSALGGFALGPVAGALNAVIVTMGWLYNVGLKSTPISFAPYAIAFGALPALACAARTPPEAASWWVMTAAALLGVAAHLTNALPDLDDDRDTGIRGLPHLIGARGAGTSAFVAVAVAAVLVVVGTRATPALAMWLGLVALLAIAGAGIALTAAGRTDRTLMRLVMLGALIDAALLISSGPALLA
jgi:4-hydroxybenzoate polyprenyltransferase